MFRFFAVLLLVLASFAYGVATVKYRIFPYALLDAAFESLRSTDQPTTRGGTTPSGVDAERLAALADAPYLGGVSTAPKVANVTVYDPERAQDGLNLVVSGHRAEARLQDMKGNTLHRWQLDFDQVWPGPLGFAAHDAHRGFWRRAHVFPNGDLLAIFDGIGLIKLDRDSKLLWKFQGHCHHDIFVDERGHIFTLSRFVRDDHPQFRTAGPIQEDFITELTPDGNQVGRVSVLQSFLNSDFASVLATAKREGDILHTNTIELMDGRFADRLPMFAKGNALISCPAINTVAVIDPRKQRVVWAITGMWVFQHQPTVLDNGNILVFDNQGQRGHSKVIEFDPRTQQVVWAYRSTVKQKFFSKVLGSCQRLRNGNTLITESTTGRAFEVTPALDLVWEYFNPDRAGVDDVLIASLFEVVRLDREYFAADFAPAQVPDGASVEVDLGGIDRLLGPPGEKKDGP